jgi:hypothetical protein
MPRRKRPAHELTTDEALKKMFPKPVREQLAQEARNARKNEGSRSMPRHSN